MIPETFDIQRQREMSRSRHLREISDRLDGGVIGLILCDARSHCAWISRPIWGEMLRTCFKDDCVIL